MARLTVPRSNYAECCKANLIFVVNYGSNVEYAERFQLETLPTFSA